MICLTILLNFFIIANIHAFNQDTDWKDAQSFYDFRAPDLDGNEVSMEKYRGHVVIVFNGPIHCPVARKSYKLLENLQKTYGESKGVKVVTFVVDGLVYSSGSQQEIKDNIKTMSLPNEDFYGKIDEHTHPLYKWMMLQLNEKVLSASKVLIDKNGKVVAKYRPTGSLAELEEKMKQIL